MHFLDYLRLGFAGVKAQKKRALVVIIIVGLLFSVLIAGSFVLQGLENVALAEMLAPTKGQVLVMSTVDQRICGEACDVKAEAQKIKQNIEQYNGKIIEAKINQTADGTFYQLNKDIFTQPNDEAADDVIQIVVPLSVAAKLAGREMSGIDIPLDKKIQNVRKVHAQILHQTIESKSGEKYHIAEILPGRVYTSDLSFSNIGQPYNPLNMIFAQVDTGNSQNFLIKSSETQTESNVEDMGLVFAQFPDIQTAYEHYNDKANYCSEADRAFEHCGEDYRYQVTSAISDPINTYKNFQTIWLIYKITATALTTIALIIAFSTYTRLIDKDLKIIALYHATGATKSQIRLVYMTYLMILSLITIGFALILGLILAIVLSLINSVALEQVFMLSFGVIRGNVWLIGWNNLIWSLIGAIMLAAIVAVILGNGNFKTKELAKKLK